MLAPDRIRLGEGEAPLVRMSTPLYVCRKCILWGYASSAELGGLEFALKIVLVHDLHKGTLNKDQAFQGRLAMRDKINRETKRVAASDDVVVPHVQLPRTVPHPHSANDRCKLDSLLELSAQDAATGADHTLLWGAQLMSKARFDVSAVVRFIGNRRDDYRDALVQIARLAIDTVIRLKRKSRMYQVDFKWENCGFFRSDDTLNYTFKLLDTSGIVSSDDQAQRQTTYANRFPPQKRSPLKTSADEEMVIWCMGVALLQLSNPENYKLIGQTFKMKDARSPIDVMTIERITQPKKDEVSLYIFAVGLRCFRFKGKPAITTLRKLRNAFSIRLSQDELKQQQALNSCLASYELLKRVDTKTVA
ncbi:hypothetical protein CYMTET_44324 [Cymbomonas tetramitiformis]|uniref:Uncharacterized protein n=1 Tax=Cymbomonas tetramitiformis TaxID=36881 RepID=A0AAE0C0E7_9CHLO|nr:hypothetical protein CYMTET_44324 [Cymbomonas tetramitiformis]